MISKDLSIIIVNYNTKDLLRGCIDSVLQYTTDIKYEIIVVDNNSSDGSTNMLKEEYKAIRLIENAKNVGFARANNQGMSIASGQFILLLNSDTVLLDNVLIKLVNFLKVNKQVGIVGPKVLNEDKSLQFSFGKFPGIKAELERTFFLEYRLTRMRMQNDLRLSANVPFSVDWVSGCCFMIRREVYEKIGGLDEQFFLFNEEVDWCLRVKKAEWLVFYVPKCEIIHYGGKSTQKNYYIFIKSRYHSRLLFFKKHYSISRQLVFRSIVVFALLLRLLFVSFTFSNQKERKERFSAYRDALFQHIGLK